MPDCNKAVVILRMQLTIGGCASIYLLHIFFDHVTVIPLNSCECVGFKRLSFDCDTNTDYWRIFYRLSSEASFHHCITNFIMGLLGLSYPTIFVHFNCLRSFIHVYAVRSGVVHPHNHASMASGELSMRAQNSARV